MGELRLKSVIVSARANGIRVSPHFYNTEEEIDKLVNEVKRCMMYRIVELDEDDRQNIIRLRETPVRHVFALYDIQHELANTRMYVCFDNEDLEAYNI